MKPASIPAHQPVKPAQAPVMRPALPRAMIPPAPVRALKPAQAPVSTRVMIPPVHTRASRPVTIPVRNPVYPRVFPFPPFYFSRFLVRGVNVLRL